MNLGLAYLKQDDYTRALPYFRRLHTLSPSDAQAATLYATCLVYGGHEKDALEILNTLTQGKGDPAALYLLGVAYTRAGQKTAGEEAFARMLSSQDTKAQANFLLGKAYYDSDRFEEAEQAFKEVLAADPEYPGAHRELGKVYLSLRRNSDAETELQAALHDDPDDASSIYFLGGLYVLTGEYEKSLPYLERAHKLTPEFWAILYYLGKAEMKLGHTQAAVDDLQKAAELGRGFPALSTLQRLPHPGSRRRIQESHAAGQRIARANAGCPEESARGQAYRRHAMKNRRNSP